MKTFSSRGAAVAILPMLALLPLFPDTWEARQDPVPVVAGADAPTAEHGLLQRLVGSWACAPRGATAKVQAIGAYHVDFEFHGAVMGAPYTARLLLGYCPLERRFFALQLDNLSASPMRLSGTGDPATGRITLRGTCAAVGGSLGACVLRLAIADGNGFSYGLAAVADDGDEHVLATLPFQRVEDVRTTVTPSAGDDR